MNKNQQILAYLSKMHPRASVTVFMKMCYLIDLVAVKKNGQQILDYTYRRYNYGPFDSSIYKDIYFLRDKGYLIEGSDFTPTGEEFTYYSINAEKEIAFSDIQDDEMNTINEITETLKGYSAKTLTEICYKTKPMKALGATLGGDENLNKKLDLSLVNA